jgi:Arc/MetJ family transcription regulator
MMRRMTLNLDEGLLEEAARELKTATPSATVQHVLKEVVRWKKRERTLELQLKREDARRRAKTKMAKKKSS